MFTGYKLNITVEECLMRRTYFLLTGLIIITFMLTVGCTQADKLSVEEAWARPGSQDANSAVYFVVANNTGGADTLLSAESDIATAVELHESMIKPVDEGQGELAKPVEDEPHEHMEAHHQDGGMEDHEHEDGEHCEDHQVEGEHQEDHHGDGDMENHEHEDCEHCEDPHEAGEHHDDHHADGEIEDHEHEDGEHCEDPHAQDEHHDAHHADGIMEDHELEECEHLDAQIEGGDMGNTMAGSMDANMASGVMMMVQQENIPVSAQNQIEFKPGGLHVMLIGLNQDLNTGDVFQVTLNFEKAGQITMDVPVKQP